MLTYGQPYPGGIFCFSILMEIILWTYIFLQCSYWWVLQCSYWWVIGEWLSDFYIISSTLKRRYLCKVVQQTCFRNFLKLKILWTKAITIVPFFILIITYQKWFYQIFWIMWDKSMHRLFTSVKRILPNNTYLLPQIRFSFSNAGLKFEECLRVYPR